MSEKVLENQELRKCVRRKAAISRKKILLNERIDHIKLPILNSVIFFDSITKDNTPIFKCDNNEGFKNICNKNKLSPKM